MPRSCTPGCARGKDKPTSVKGAVCPFYYLSRSGGTFSLPFQDPQGGTSITKAMSEITSCGLGVGTFRAMPAKLVRRLLLGLGLLSRATVRDRAGREGLNPPRPKTAGWSGTAGRAAVVHIGWRLCCVVTARRCYLRSAAHPTRVASYMYCRERVVMSAIISASETVRPRARTARPPAAGVRNVKFSKFYVNCSHQVERVFHRRRRGARCVLGGLLRARQGRAKAPSRCCVLRRRRASRPQTALPEGAQTGTLENAEWRIASSRCLNASRSQ